MLRHVFSDFDALVMANCMELAGMTVVSVTTSGNPADRWKKYDAEIQSILDNAFFR